MLNAEGTLANKERAEPAVSESQALNWYKNMLTGTSDGIFVTMTAKERDTTFSEHHGQYHVRSTETWSIEFLHGLKP